MKKFFSWVIATLICGASLVTSCSDDDDKEKEEKKEEANVSGLLACPDNNHPHAIDLGLPSGTKWACCNVGASSPEQYGDYFAWGETQPKSSYTMSNYAYYNSSTGDFFNIGSDIAGTGYDAATANWGAPWRMPTKEQIQELLNNFSSRWTSKNGVYGREFTGPNGGTIFLPAAGYRWLGDLYNAGSNGYYSSSTLYGSNEGDAYSLDFNSGNTYWYISDRQYGPSVRPVRRN